MKRITALLIALLLLVSLASCNSAEQGGNSEAEPKDAPTASQTEAATNAAEPAQAEAVDISGWNWIDGELDCYNYDDCYMSYQYPEQFKTSSEDSSGYQSRSYYYNPSNAEADANGSPYGLYISFGQGSFGGMTKSSLEETAPNGLSERELGGRQVLFAELSSDPNTGAHAFAYYLAYDEDEWSRIWIILCDPEEDGAFRKTFENSISFAKD
ncbi:MAG: hypothetical protein IJG87_02590 [Ruminococcus sp.]|nr:hypothetical protein [Ruminococcus sp.]